MAFSITQPQQTAAINNLCVLVVIKDVELIIEIYSNEMFTSMNHYAKTIIKKEM